VRLEVAAARQDGLRIGDMEGGVGLLEQLDVIDDRAVREDDLGDRVRERPTATMEREWMSTLRPAGSLTCKISIGRSSTTFAGTIT
jgi:hypothetical protein